MAEYYQKQKSTPAEEVKEVTGEVTLFGGWGSPFSRRIEIALKLKGVEYDFILEDILVKKSPLLLKYNPVHKKVPVLVHKGKPICESVVILEYIDEIWKDYPFLPEDPYERAMARFWAKFLDEKCIPAAWRSNWTFGPEKEKILEEAFEHLQTLEEKALGDKKFFGGDSIGLVDIVASFLGYWLPNIQEATGVEVLTSEKYPKLYRWSQDFCSNSVIMENVPPKDPLVAFMKARLETLKPAV